MNATAILKQIKLLHNKEPILTGEKNLTITKKDLIKKVRENKRADEYLDAMSDEAHILVRQNLFKGYIKDREIYFDIPDYDLLIIAVHAFCESYKDPDEDSL